MAIRSQSWQNVKAGVAERKVFALSLLTGTTLAGAGLAISLNNGSFGSRAEAAITAYAPDVESILDSRSPGQRRYGWLLNNKPDRLAFSAEDPPSERVLPATRRRPAGGADVPSTPDSPLTTLDFMPDAVVPSSDIGDLAVPGAIGGIGPGSTPIIGGIPGPGGGGSGGSDNTPGNPVTPTPVTAVPEPSSWAMLVLGFATLGTFMRRRKSGLVAFNPR